MKYETEDLERLRIVGIAIRTTNEGGRAQRDIGQLWNDFLSNNVMQNIPNRVSDDVYCIYTDYESDHRGEYTTILGCLVQSPVDSLPKGLIYKEIPACRYHKFVSEGIIPDCVTQVWQHIWSMVDYTRKYLADFDVYAAEATDPNNAKVTTFLSIK